MQTSNSTGEISKATLWASYALSGLPILLLTMSATMKLLQPDFIVEGLTKYGYDANLVLPLGIVELVCTLLYAAPRTSVLGAILLSGYLGGTTATHVRFGDMFIVPIIIGVLVWLGLYLRDVRLRALVPLRR